MPTIHERTVPRRHPDAIFRNIEGQGLVVLPGAGEVKVLNPAGAFIWEQIDGKRTVEQIARAVVAGFDVDYATAREDILEFLATLQDKEMLFTTGEA